MDLFPFRSRYDNVFKGLFDPEDIGGSYDKSIQPRNSSPIPFSNLFSDDSQLGDTSNTGKPNVSDMLMNIYGEKSPAMERYNKFLEDQPTHKDYEPSGKRKLLAALAGFGVGLSNPEIGYKVASNIVEKPFEDARSDWERRRIPIQNAATEEERNRTNRINSLKDYVMAQHNAMMDESLVGHRNTTEKQAAANLEALKADRAARERDRAVNSARQAARDTETIRQHNWEQSHGNTMASIAARNAASAESNARSHASTVEGLNNYRNHLIRKYESEKNTPGAQRTATELATHNVILKPGNSQIYANYYDQDDKGRIVLQPPTQGHFTSDDSFNSSLSEYSKLLKEIDDEKKRIMNDRKEPAPSNTGQAGQKPGGRVVGRKRD